MNHEETLNSPDRHIDRSRFLSCRVLDYLPGRPDKATAERKILHYVDPMNPAFKSDKPGIAPCGMPLEPVYADQGDARRRGSRSPGVHAAGNDPDLRGKAAVDRRQNGDGRKNPLESYLAGAGAGDAGRDPHLPDQRRSSTARSRTSVPSRPAAWSRKTKSWRQFIPWNTAIWSRILLTCSASARKALRSAKPMPQSSKYSGGQVGEGSQIEYYRKNLLTLRNEPPPD